MRRIEYRVSRAQEGQNRPLSFTPVWGPRFFSVRSCTPCFLVVFASARPTGPTEVEPSGVSPGTAIPQRRALKGRHLAAALLETVSRVALTGFNSEEILFTAGTNCLGLLAYMYRPFRAPAEMLTLPRAHAAGLRFCQPFGPLILWFVVILQMQGHFSISRDCWAILFSGWRCNKSCRTDLAFSLSFITA